MARKKGGREGEQGRQHSPRRSGPAAGRRTIKRDQDRSELLERGEGPSEDEVIDPSVASPSEITAEGGPGTDASYRAGGPSSGGRVPNPRSRGTGGEGGYSTLGGGVYPDEGAPEDATWRGDQFSPERRSGGDRRSASGGLRSYRRPDESLAREIHEILTKDPELDATEIEVEVEGGAVTLTGEVESSDAKLLAEELVESTPGVREVHNRLRIAR
ncbi:MAG TPA: BON domain-containing protein [Gemmatimonadales bacterium]|nr:BON domain-containing protein [Gemmatimonadales bacterium]